MGIQLLRGLRVLELASMVSGPFCGKLMADLGAEVVKIEAPEGDASRRRGPYPEDVPHPDRALLFNYLNVNKFGISLDLSAPGGRSAFLDLVAISDLLVEDAVPGHLHSMGLGYAQLSRVNPTLVLLSITPFGQYGAHSKWRAYNLNSIHAGGEGWLMPPGLSQRMFPDREPLKTGGNIGDYYCGVTAAVGAMVAVIARWNTGIGQWVDQSKQEAHATLARIAISLWANTGFLETRVTRDVPYGGCIPCVDGYVEILIHMGHWDAFVKMMGSPDWASDRKYGDHEGRSLNSAELNQKITEWASTRTKEEVYRLGLKFGVPSGAFLAPTEIARSEHERTRGFFVPVYTESVPQLSLMPGIPFRFSRAEYALRRPAPVLGQDNRLVSEQLLGLTPREMAKLEHESAA